MVASPRAKFKTLIRTRMDATPLQNAVNYCRWIVDTVEASSRGHIGSSWSSHSVSDCSCQPGFPDWMHRDGLRAERYSDDELELLAGHRGGGTQATPLPISGVGIRQQHDRMLRLALKTPSLHGAVLSSVEHDPEFASTLLSLLTQTFSDAATEVVISIGPIPKSKPSVVEALRRDPGISRYEARFVQTLWDTYNHRFWITAAKPNAAHHQRLAMLHRRLIRLQGSAALRWERIRRALDSDARSEPFTILDTTHGRSLPREISPSLITFDSEQVRLEYLVTPQLRNRLSRPGFILDGLYQEFADYVTAPLHGPFDVILVDGRARTSCVKRAKHDNLLAPGGTLFIHNAHRPSYHEAFQEFGTWSFVRGCRTSKPGVVGTDANLTSEPPQPPAAVRSGNSTTAAEWVNDHELFYFEAPDSP